MPPWPEPPVSSVPPRRLLGNGSFPPSSLARFAKFLRAGAEIGHYTNNAGLISSDTLLSKKSIAPYLLQDKAINVTPILNFTIGSNYCTVLNLNENSSEKEELNIYPNPSNNIINITSS